MKAPSQPQERVNLVVRCALSLESAGVDHMLTLETDINGVQGARTALIQSPLVGSDDIRAWPQAVASHLAAALPNVLFDLFTEANAQASGAPPLLVEHPADTRKRLQKRRSSRRQTAIPKKRRPPKGKETLAVREARETEKRQLESELIATIRSLRAARERETLANISRSLWPKRNKHPTQKLKAQMQKYAISIEDLKNRAGI